MAVITNSNPIIFGTSGTDTITANFDGANIYGMGGNDDYLINALYRYGATVNGGSGNTDIPADIVHEGVGGGTDTVHVDLQATDDSASLGAIYGSRFYTLGDNLENLVANLSGGDSYSFGLYGNDLANAITAIAATSDDYVRVYGYGGNDNLTGSLGDDTLNGGTGNDSMAGGDGDDRYFVDAVGDKVIELSGEGNDAVYSSITFSLALLPDVENLTLTGAGNISGTGNAGANILSGNDGNNVLTGAAGDDWLHGNGGNDKLDGGVDNDRLYGDNGIDTLLGGAGFDTLSGGDGNDSLDGGADADSMNGNAGNDILIGGAGNDVMAGFDGDDLLDGGADNDFIIGENGNDKLIGGAGADSLYGGAGNDNLNGGAGNDNLNGESGDDTLDGGAGDDTFYAVDAGDIVTDTGGGTDTLRTNVQLVRDLGTGIENLTLYGSDNISGRGNALNNTIIGNDGNNLLSGLAGNDSLLGGDGTDILKGGDGNDTLDGGSDADVMQGDNGNDTYFVDDISDAVVETSALAAGGIDNVLSSVSFLLGANIENLTLTGSNPIDGTGNNIANIVTGNGGNNMLTGLDGKDTLDGGAGLDTLDGGNGDDTYIVDNLLDKVIEGLNGGIDTIKSSVTISLQDTDGVGVYGGNVENLTLTGNGNINAYGNALDNILVGNSGNNILDGMGGKNDMRGGTGDDTYFVGSTLDKVTELANAGTDTVKSSISFSLASLTNVENLQLIENAISGTGNTLNNYIIGNDGDNSLDGGTAGNDTLDGGLGADHMNGGNGNDTYYVDNTGDVITDSAGIDNVYSAVTFTLVGTTLENLTLYGSSNLTGTGNALANILTGNSGIDTLIGGAGNDTYIVNNTGDRVDEIFGSGTDLVKSSVDFSLNNIYSAGVENLTLIGSGDINGEGNNIANIITGNSGANVLTGMDGNDTYIVGAGDSVVEAIGFGTDTIKSSVDFALDDLLGAGVENLTLLGSAIIGTGNLQNNIITGNDGDNSLIGGEGNDTLIGGLGNDGLSGGLGDDSMTGGAGDDTYYVDSAGDKVIEAAGGGTDKVIVNSLTIPTYTLATNVENLTFQGNNSINGIGNTLNNYIIGNDGDNSLDGGTAGNDTLDGGLGADHMNGGNGNDTYYVDNTGDVITDSSGIDNVNSSVTFKLVGTTLENLTLEGSDDIDGTGNGLANILTGNSGANVLTGYGGNDTYIIGLGDTVVEAPGGGTDLIISSVTFYLDDSYGYGGSNVENLTLTGADNIYGYGNALANILIGNSGNNGLFGWDGNDKLDGGLGDDQLIGDTGKDTLIGGLGDDTLDGGAGDDSMTGGAGDDTYYVDSKGDKVVEAAGGGTDRVYSSISLTLGANVENLVLNYNSGDIDGTGNGLNNQIDGNNGNNVLKGGTGNDTLFGGYGGTDKLSGEAGDDVFIFRTSSTSTTTVTDFTSGADSIGLGSFIGLTFDGAGGTLTANEFHLGTEATEDVNDHIIFDATASGGNLYYDVDGLGGTSAVLIAHFSNLGVSVAATDIFEST